MYDLGNDLRSPVRALPNLRGSSSGSYICRLIPLIFLKGENFWSKVQQILRSLGAKTYQALEIAIAEAFSQVSEE
jgi:hypothetical protein